MLRFFAVFAALVACLLLLVAPWLAHDITAAGALGVDAIILAIAALIAVTWNAT